MKNNISADTKIIEFRTVVDKYKIIEDSLIEQQNCDIISIDEVREKRLLMNKKLEELVLNIHPYAFKQMTGKDTRWYTSIKKEGETRKIIKKNTYEELISFLIDYYSLKDKKKAVTLRTMYPVWIDYKKSSIKKTSTLRRIDADWRRFYLNDDIIDVPLADMTKNQISAWINSKIIHDGVVKSQVFYNMLTIFKNVFEYCYSEGLIPVNTFEKAKYRKELLEKYSKPLDETQVFTKAEVKDIVKLAFEKFDNDNRTTTYLAIALMFQTGLRCGEIVALKSTDYDEAKKTLHISKGETRTYAQNKDGSYTFTGYAIDTPKKMASVRTVPLTDEACKIISRIMQANEDNGQSDDNYLFVYNNHRVQTASVLKKIYSLCNELGFEQRSTHKIRKTVLSTMLNTCFKEDIADISAVRDFAGHVDENTLIKSYTFSTRKAETRDLAQKALNW